VKAALVLLSGALALAAPPGLVEIETPLRNSAPAGLAWGYDGKLYGVEYLRHQFFRIDPRSDTITGEWPMPAGCSDR
jgi:hypothetical protein